MADLHSHEENTKLKQQIKFLTDLIDNARKQDPKHHEKPLPFRSRPSKTPNPTMPIYAKKGKHNTGYGPHTCHFQKHKQIDKAKYSFVRTSDPQVITNPSSDNQTETAHMSRKGLQPNVVEISSNRIKMLRNDRVSSQETQVPAGKIDLNNHSLSSLKKILAAKIEAKALRNANKAVKQSTLSRRKTVPQQLSNDSQSSSNCDLRKRQEDLDNKFSQQSQLDKSILSSTNVPTSRLIVPKQSIDLSRDSNKCSTTKKLQLVQCKPRTSDDASQILEMSKQPSKLSTGSSKMSAGPSYISSGTYSASKDRSEDIPVPLPSKDDLAKGLKSTEAKIKELTAELTKLKEVAKIVNSSPQKATPKPSKRIITSASGHHLRNSSSNSNYHKYANRKHFQSNTQHAAHYVVSKYKLKKVHAKVPGHSKFKSNAKSSLFRKSSNLLHPKKSVSKHGVSSYKWTRQVKNTAFLSTKWNIKPYTNIYGNQHGKKTLIAWMPYWKRRLLLHGASSKRRNVWQKDNRGRLNSSHVFVKGNPYATARRMISTSHKGFTSARTITVRGVKFQVGTTGKTLQRVGNLSSGSLPRKSISRVDYRGVTYIETKPGTLEKTSSHQTRIRANQALLKSIAVSTRRHKLKKSGRQYCMFYCRFGKCNRGDNCTFIHDPDKVAVCTRFLRGTCRLSNCPFSHKVSKEKMPVCSYFLKGGCVKEDCPYSHVNVNKDAKVCEDFLRGFCPRGEKCKEKHILECPEFARSGQCPEGKKCKLEHRKKPVKRRISATQKVGGQKKGDVNTKTHLGEGSSSQHTDHSMNDQAKQAIPFKMMKLPAFISIVSSDSDPTSSQDTDKPPVQKPQEQLRIKPRI